MSRKFIAALVAALAAVAWSGQAHAARYAVESPGNYTYNWNFENATVGTYVYPTSTGDATKSWVRKGDANGLADAQFDVWNTSLSNGGSGTPNLGIAHTGNLLKVDPSNTTTTLGNAGPLPQRIQYYQFRPGVTVTQFVYQADMSWANVTDRMRNIGLKWRNDPLDNANYGTQGQSSLDGEDTGGSTTEGNTGGSKLKLFDGGDAVSVGKNYDTTVNAAPSTTLGWQHDFGVNYVGDINLTNDLKSNGQFTVQIEYNLNNSGLIDIYYRSRFDRQLGTGHSGANPSVPWNNSYNVASAGNPTDRGNGNWVLLRSIPILAVESINEFALGTNDSTAIAGVLGTGGRAGASGSTGVGFDNVYLKIVPEPGSFVLLGLAVPAIAMWVRRRRAA